MPVAVGRRAAGKGPIREMMQASNSRQAAVGVRHQARHRVVPRASPRQTLALAQPVQSIQDVVQQQRYKAVLLDQFGVLHDGQVAAPAAIEACKALHAKGIALYVLSNSSRRASGTLERLEKLGYSPDWFAGAVTSGELTFQHLLNRPTEWWRTLGRKVLHLTWKARGAVSLEGLNLAVVDQPEEADFILAHGTEAVSAQWDRPVRELTLAQMNQFLDRCAHANRLHKTLPMVVANPDLVTVNGKDLVVMPGTLAKTYQELGGPVRIMGKPDRIIFDAALEGLGGGLTADQVLVVGDSLHHDIAGAAAAGMDSLLVAGGIHAKELLPQQAGLDQEALKRLCEQHGATPTFVATALNW